MLPPISLVDRGANSGLAGADVHVLERTGRKVFITGIGVTQFRHSYMCCTHPNHPWQGQHAHA